MVNGFKNIVSGNGPDPVEIAFIEGHNRGCNTSGETAQEAWQKSASKKCIDHLKSVPLMLMIPVQINVKCQGSLAMRFLQIAGWILLLDALILRFRVKGLTECSRLVMHVEAHMEGLEGLEEGSNEE